MNQMKGFARNENNRDDDILLFYLPQKNISAKIDYPLLRETKEIILEDNDRKVLDDIEKNIEDIFKQETVPKCINKKICKKRFRFYYCF